MQSFLRKFQGISLAAIFVFSTTSAWADEPPPCMAYNNPKPINNQEVNHWKRTTPNQFRERAHVKGNVIHLYPDHSGHLHFEIAIGPNDGDTIEVIYNQDFGNATLPKMGDVVEACGDYITSTAQAGGFPASPDGAIIHWVHKSPNEQRHPDGFMFYDNTLFGQATQNAGPKHGGCFGRHCPQ